MLLLINIYNITPMKTINNNKTSNELTTFENKKVRQIEYNGELYFSVVDIIAILTDNDYQHARNYWKVLKNRLINEGADELVTKCNQLKMPAEDGKLRATDCANIETMFRIIQSIPSPKAEPIKQWLARVGYERIQEIENPELSQQRMMEIYRQKGYSNEWILERIQSIVDRKNLTDEWKNRGATEQDYSIFTSIMSKATFGIKPSEHKEIKKLKKGENLRDNMTRVEIALVNLSEATAHELHKSRNTQGKHNLMRDVKEAGDVAGKARLDIEKRTGKKVVSSERHINTDKNKMLDNFK